MEMATQHGGDDYEKMIKGDPGMEVRSRDPRPSLRISCNMHACITGPDFLISVHACLAGPRVRIYKDMRSCSIKSVTRKDGRFLTGGGVCARTCTCGRSK